MGERWRHKEEHNEHIGVNVTKRVTNLSINNMSFSSYNLRFIEMERRKITVKKRFEKRGRLSGGYGIPLGMLSNVFSLPTTCCLQSEWYRSRK